MPTIGQKLEDTRLSRGLSIEDVSHETRIHPNMILRIEEDDFSQFPSVAYAKSFIRKYSDHLGVDLSEAMEALNSGVTRLADNELMGEMKKTIKKDRRFRIERFGRAPSRRPEKAGGAPLFLNFVLAALMAALGIFYFLGYNAPTPEKAREDIARGLGLSVPITAEPAAAAENAPLEVNPLKPTKPVEAAAAPAPATPTVVAAPTPAPGTPPVYPVIKPDIDLKFEDTLGQPPPAKVDAAPRARETPRMDLADDSLAPPPLGDLPAAAKSRPEPQAVLRPEGTDPAATTKRSPEPTPGQAAPPKPDSAAAPQGALRAKPVAASE